MRPAKRRELPMARATVKGRLATSTTSHARVGQPHNRRRARATSRISAPTDAAHPNHCIQPWRSSPRERTYRRWDPMTPMGMAITVSARTSHNGSDGRRVHSATPTPRPST